MYYEPSPDPNLLWQGDIIKEFIVPDPPEQTFFVRNPPPIIPSFVANNGKFIPIRAIYRKEELEDAFASPKEALVVEATLTNIAIVSQSCDIDRKPFLTVAMVRPISSIANAARRDDLKRWDKVFEYFWLPQCDSLEESIIDLTLLYSV